MFKKGDSQIDRKWAVAPFSRFYGKIRVGFVLTQESAISKRFHFNTAWKVSKYGFFSGPYTGKYGPEKAPYLDSFYAV